MSPAPPTTGSSSQSTTSGGPFGDVQSRTGEIITFYSYKGGVGRSMALANVGTMLAREHGKEVILVDWDLEAPGLHRFFGISDQELKSGLIDYLLDYKSLLTTRKDKIKPEALSIEPYLIPVGRDSGLGRIRLLSAGAKQHQAQYATRVGRFNWDAFYRDWNGAHFIEALRSQLKHLADYALIDSRTGITDTGGVCTTQLPDTVVFVFVYNEQNISGVERIASDLASKENKTLVKLGRRPELLFLPSRKELAEITRLREWEQLAERRLGPFFSESPRLVSRYSRPLDLFQKAAIPYVPHFAYGEEIAADTPKGFEMIEALRLFVDIIRRAEQPTSQRSEIVVAARVSERDERSESDGEESHRMLAGIIARLATPSLGRALVRGLVVTLIIAYGALALAQFVTKQSVGQMLERACWVVRTSKSANCADVYNDMLLASLLLPALAGMLGALGWEMLRSSRFEQGEWRTFSGSYLRFATTLIVGAVGGALTAGLLDFGETNIIAYLVAGAFLPPYLTRLIEAALPKRR